MAKAKRRKTNTSTKTRTSTSSRKKQNKIDIDLAVVSMIVISILLTVLIYTSSGYIGKTLSPLLGGLMGWMKYILPIGTFAIAINLACEKKETLTPKLMQYAIFLVCIASIMCTFQISKGTINMEKEFGEILTQAYELGQKNIGGGAIGMIATVPAVNMLGETGAVILEIGIGIIVLIFMFSIHPAKMITDAVENMEERKELRRERRLEEDEEYEEEEEEIIVKPVRTPKPKKTKKSSIDIPLDDDISIGLNANDKLQKYDHSEDDLTIIGMKNAKPSKKRLNELESMFEDEKEQLSTNELGNAVKQEQKQQSSPNELENIFKTEQEVKEEKTKEVLVLEHTLTEEDEKYEFPPIELLSEGTSNGMKGSKKAIADNATRLQKTLFSFGVSAKVENVSIGPTITRYELKPAEGVRVNKIANLADDIALNLAAESIRIEAPIPGKQAVGIEVPNKETEMVHLRDILESNKFVDYESKLAFALGKDVAGNEVVTDIAKMPHVLIAGSTGSRKECMY